MRALLVVALVSGCGTKTGLEIPDCPDGGFRACANECGEGASACIDGEWQPCEVPLAERPCADACGDGVELCADGAWQRCVVAPATRACTTACGDGLANCDDGAWGPCSSQPLPPLLRARVRDFSSAHPDFEGEVVGDDRGMVDSTLGADGKPVYLGPTPTTHGRAAFDQWFRDVPGVNESAELPLTLRASGEDPPVYVYDDLEFFPIDDMLFGNEGRAHNFHFTVEAVAEFEYVGGERFAFRGDDDVFVFINERLAIDLGGVHGAEEASVELDERAGALGLVLGRRYPIHFFFAERHTDRSTFTLETTIVDPLRCR